MISLHSGRNDLPRLLLRAADGAEAEIYLHGAHVTAWRPAGSGDALFLSDASSFEAGEPIRGGVPVVFPQFSGNGPLPKHGFARTESWEWVNREGADSAESAVLRLADNPATRDLWPHAFLLQLTVTPHGDSLTLDLSVENRGEAELDFSAALHTYLRISDIARTSVLGLEGARYRSNPEGVKGVADPAAVLTFGGEIDRVYGNAPRELTVNDEAGDRRFRIGTEGFQDVVVWNPGAALAASIPDLGTEEYRTMLCVEAAQVEAPVRLAPGATWRGAQRLRSVSAQTR